MAFRVFLSYSLDPAEHALAWRLQTLAAAHGIEMYVPQRGPALSPAAAMESSTIRSAMDRSDCVLAIITAEANANVQRELNYALAKGKLVVPIVRSDLASHPFLAQFPRVFVFSPWDHPGQAESEIVGFLKSQQISKDKQQAIAALAALGLGLLALFSLTEK